MVAFCRLPTPKRLEARVHSTKVPQLDFIVMRARDDACAGRVDSQCRHDLRRVSRLFEFDERYVLLCGL